MNELFKSLLMFLYLYFHREKWEKVNIVKNDNGTISFNQKKVYTFSDEESNGLEDDVSGTTINFSARFDQC